MYIIYLDTELYPVVQSGKYAVLYRPFIIFIICYTEFSFDKLPSVYVCFTHFLTRWSLVPQLKSHRTAVFLFVCVFQQSFIYWTRCC